RRRYDPLEQFGLARRCTVRADADDARQVPRLEQVHAHLLRGDQGMRLRRPRAAQTVPGRASRDLGSNRRADREPDLFLRVSLRAALHRARTAGHHRVCPVPKGRYSGHDRAEAMKIAIFDIDGTLVTGSSERAFWRSLLLRGKQGPRQVLAFLLFMARYLPIGGIHTPRKNKAYLSGLRVDEVEALAREFVAERLVHRLYEPVVQRLKQHQNRGDLVVLMSG